MDFIDKSRKEIDTIDGEIAALLQKRWLLASDIAAYKEQNHLPIVDKQREEEILTRLKKHFASPFLQECAERCFSSIIEQSKLVEQFSQKRQNPFAKVGIIGIGLIGGSIAKAIKSKDPSVQISSLRREDQDIDRAMQSHMVDTCFSSLQELIDHVDVLILSPPLSFIETYAKEISSLSQGRKEKLLVLDVGSIKERICSSFAKLSHEGVEFVATHPMAGREKGSFPHSLASLFTGRCWALCPHPHTTEEALNTVRDFLCFLGAHPLIVTGEEHDRHAACISHLPYILSHAFLQFTQRTCPEALQMSGPGFASFIRLGQDSPELHEDIYSMNGNNIRPLLQSFLTYLQQQEHDAK